MFNVGKSQQTDPLDNFPLTDFQQLDLLQKNNARNGRVQVLRPAFEEQAFIPNLQKKTDFNTQFLGTTRRIELPRQKNQFGLSPQFDQQVQALQSQPRGFPFQQQQNTLKPPTHPEQLLNQLNPKQKQQFLHQFDQLTRDQQVYAYNKFLSTPQDIQLFAINQFLSLDIQVLATALQDEIAREPILAKNLLEFLPGQKSPSVLPSQLQAQPSQADQLASLHQKEALQQIINLQNSINFPQIK